MRSSFPYSSTVRTEVLAHRGFHKLLLTRLSRSIDDFLKANDIPIISYTVEKMGDSLYVSTVDGENADKLSMLNIKLLGHLNTNSFDIRAVVIEKKIED